MKSKLCTHVVQRVEVGLYKAVTPRSWQGHLKVTARSQQSQINTKVLNKAYFCCFCSNFVHLRWPWWLKPSRTPIWIYTKHTQEVTGVFLCWRGHTPSNHAYVIPVWNGANNKMMAVLRPMVNTSISCEEIQPKYTWGHGFRMYFWGVLPQGHGKVISRSQQVKSTQKRGK